MPELTGAVPKRSGACLFGAAAVLVAVTAAAYLPAAIDGGFVWDDDAWVTENPLLVGPNGLGRIWFSDEHPSQYFPLVYTTFWFEHALWGLHPRGYHVTNIVLHAINALLVWRILTRLRVPGAYLAAAIFALHPVHVESVAWITERKNVLVMLFSALSVLAWLRFVDPAGGARVSRWRYALSLLLCALALVSKTTACTLPAALVLVLWVRRIPVSTRRWLQIMPYVVLGLAMGLLTMWWEHDFKGSVQPDSLGVAPVERTLIASRAVWFYLEKLIWPTKLTFSYPKWDVDAAQILQYLPLVALLITAACLWRWRARIGRGPIAALVFFVATLSPMLGLISLYTFYYTYVADHYQYVASVGPIALFAAGATRLADRIGVGAKTPAVVTAVILLAGLGTLTWQQASQYESGVTLWRDALRNNPDSWMAHTNLGILLDKRGERRDAMWHYRQVLRIRGDDGAAHTNLAHDLLAEGNVDEAIEHY